MLGKIEGRRRGQPRMKWLDGVTDSMNMSLCKLQEIEKVREAWRAVVHGVTKSRTRLSEQPSSLLVWLGVLRKMSLNSYCALFPNS